MFSVPWYAIVLISVPQSILILKIGFGLFNLQVNARQCFLLSGIMAVVTYFLRKLPLLFGIHTIILVLLLTILVVVLQRIDFWRSLAAVLLGVMIFGVIENAYLPLLLQITSKTVLDLAEQPWFNIAAFLPELLLGLLLYAFIRQAKFILFDLKKAGEVKRPINQGVFVIAVILLQSFLLVLISASLLVNQQRFNIAAIVPWANIIVLLIAILSIVAIKQLEENSRSSQRVQLLKSHLQQVELLLKVLQSQKHEYSRHIQAIQSLVYLKRYQEIKEYIEGIAEEYWQMEEILYTGHPVLTGLLNSKRSFAESQGIEFAVAVKCDPAEIPIPPWDICSILGNLLDNAMEAALEDKGKPRVAIEFKYEFQHYVISIQNNGARIPAGEKEWIFEPGYTNKDSPARGYGLYLVSRLLERYQGTIEVMSKGQTSVIIKLADKGSNIASSKSYTRLERWKTGGG
ncbi:MAG: GHKL domain-containing protein [Syntrophomonas sp.]|nr:GHKL domain-containing protein [Syntrophomonas sp.]MDD3878392.1 GHKL domain-containing protein [Syntrophomonas sp.]